MRARSRAALGFVHRNQLTDSHEFESLGCKSVEGGGHRIDSLLMDIVGENNRAGPGTGEDPFFNDRRAWPLPIERVYRPYDDAEAELFLNPILLPGSDRAVGRSHQHRRVTGRVFDRVLGLVDLFRDSIVGQFRKLWMSPRVVPDLVALGENSFHNRWIALGVLTNHEEGRFDVSLLENVEEPRRGFRTRAVVEGHGDVGAIDIDAEPGRWFRRSG